MPPKPASSSSSDETSSGEEEEVEDKVVPPTNPKPTAPKPQSSGSNDGDEEESSDEEEEDSPPSLTPPSKSKPAPASAPAASASESGSSASESGSPAPAAKPRASKPPPSPTKPSPATPTAATPEKKKRKAPATPAATPATTPSGAAPKRFQLIWTEEEELAILQGMLDYKAKTGILVPIKEEMEAFRRFIQKSLRVEATTYRLFDKVRRMKWKYLKTRANTPSRFLVQPHDAAVYELSQKVWGSGDGDGVNGSRAKKRRTSMVKVEKLEKAEKDDEEEDNVVEGDNDGEGVRKGRYMYFTDAVLRMENCIGRGFPVKDAMGMIDEAKAKELDRKYMILKVQQMKSYMRGMELNKEGMKVVTEALDKEA